MAIGWRRDISSEHSSRKVRRSGSISRRLKGAGSHSLKISSYLSSATSIRRRSVFSYLRYICSTPFLFLSILPSIAGGQKQRERRQEIASLATRQTPNWS